MSDRSNTGWAFPISVDARGRIALSRRDRDIEESIAIIVLTPPEERMMRPDFGCHIHTLNRTLHNVAIMSAAAAYVEEALAKWEPRIAVQRVIVAVDHSRSGTLVVEVRYVVKSTQERRLMSIPVELPIGSE